MSAETKTPGQVEYCSFCGKSQHEVKVIIAGPRVLICDECIDLCASIVREKRPRKVIGYTPGAMARKRGPEVEARKSR